MDLIKKIFAILLIPIYIMLGIFYYTGGVAFASTEERGLERLGSQLKDSGMGFFGKAIDILKQLFAYLVGLFREKVINRKSDSVDFDE